MADWLSNLVQQLSPREDPSLLVSPKGRRQKPSPSSKARAQQSLVTSPIYEKASPTMGPPAAKVEPLELTKFEIPSAEVQFHPTSSILLPEQPKLALSTNGKPDTHTSSSAKMSGGESRKADADIRGSSTEDSVKDGGSTSGGVVSVVEGVTVADSGSPSDEATATLAKSPEAAAAGAKKLGKTQDADSSNSSGASNRDRDTEEDHRGKSSKTISSAEHLRGAASPTKRRTLPVLSVRRGEQNQSGTQQDEEKTDQAKLINASQANKAPAEASSASSQRASDTQEDSHSSVLRAKSAPSISGSSGQSQELIAGGSGEAAESEPVSASSAPVPIEETGPLPVAGIVGGELAAMISSTRACLYEATEFFVAWQGVLTVAYSGIPPALCELKARMGAALPSMAPENPGSRWPKTTLACLRDDQRLTPEQLSTLRDICSTMSFQLALSPPVVVDTLSVVLYETCCLEKQLSATHIPLQQPVDPTPPSLEQRQYVRNVVDEFASRNLTKYWLHASKDGNRSSHYRKPKMGATVVHFLEPREVPAALAVFRRLVDAALPGLYDWFSEDSLHITLRALC